MPIFGDNTAGGDEFPGATDRALLDRYTLTEDGTATSISIYAGASSTSGANWKGLIYTDSAGAPNTLVAVSQAGAAPAGGGWVTLNFSSPPALTAGNYWIGVVADSFQAYYGEDVTGSAPDVVMANGTLSYASPPSTWPGTDASYGVGLDVYVTYTVADARIYPNSDVTTTSWTLSTGTSYFGVVDEATFSDTDYMISPAMPTSSNMILGLNNSLTAGSYLVKIRSRYTGSSGQIRISLLNGSNVSQGTSAWVPVTGSFSQYNIPVTITGTASRIQIEVQQ